MTVFLNGQFVPDTQASVSIFDRSFLYGDGLFETMLVANGKPFRWAQHLARLEAGARFLRIKLPFAPAALAGFAAELIARNNLREGLLRLTLSRGVGERGYSPKGADKPTFVMTLHPVGGPTTGIALRWRVRTASIRLPSGEALAQFKTCNKLPQVLARAEAEFAGADEALLLNTDGYVAEAASSNLFWLHRGTVYTPPLDSGVLAGVTRDVVRELCPKLKLTCQEANIRPEDLLKADGVFLSLSSHGIVELAALDGEGLASSPQVMLLSQAYWLQVRAECG